MASLGSFDLLQYDDLPDWQRTYALALHIAVLITFMLIVVNLLIAILSDEYASLNEVKTGLYWSAIIEEMPKYAYDKRYGTLSMLPFVFSWISLCTIPFMKMVKDRKKLEMVTFYVWVVVYLPIALIVLSLFITVNLVLLPFAYLKTLVHKAALMKRYRA